MSNSQIYVSPGEIRDAIEAKAPVASLVVAMGFSHHGVHADITYKAFTFRDKMPGLLQESGHSVAQHAFMATIRALYVAGQLPPSANLEALTALPPVSDPWSVIDAENAPLHADWVPEDMDPRLTSDLESLHVWDVEYRETCHDECPYDWVIHFQAACFSRPQAYLESTLQEIENA